MHARDRRKRDGKEKRWKDTSNEEKWRMEAWPGWLSVTDEGKKRKRKERRKEQKGEKKIHTTHAYTQKQIQMLFCLFVKRRVSVFAFA